MMRRVTRRAKDGRLEVKRLGGAAKRPARLSLYAADGADRILRPNLAADEARKKRHRNDDQPKQHGVPLRKFFYMPSAMNDRDFVVLTRVAVVSFVS